MRHSFISWMNEWNEDDGKHMPTSRLKWSALYVVPPILWTVPGRHIFQYSPYNSSQQLPQQEISLSLLLKCPILYAKQCHMSSCQSLGLAPLVCLKGPCTCWPCQCPLAQKSHHHTVTEAEKLFSGKVYFSTETHHHHQTLSLESSMSIAN